MDLYKLVNFFFFSTLARVKLIPSRKSNSYILFFCRKILRIIIDHLNEKDTTIQVTVLQTLRAIFQAADMKPCWSDFLELLTIRVLDAHKDEKREVS